MTYKIVPYLLPYLMLLCLKISVKITNDIPRLRIQNWTIMARLSLSGFWSRQICLLPKKLDFELVNDFYLLFSEVGYREIRLWWPNCFHSKPSKLYKWSRWPTYGKHLTLWKCNCALSLVQTHSSDCRDKRSNWKAGGWTCQRRGTLIL